MSMTWSRIAAVYLCLIGLTLWLVIACTAPIPVPVTPSPGHGARLFTRTPTPTATPIPTLDPYAIYRQGLARRAAWDLETALDRFDIAVTMSPSAPFYASRAEVYRLTSRYEEAAADIERALALDPRLAGAWREKALLSSAEATWDDALTAVNKLIELEPDDGAAYAARAQIYSEGFGKIQKALIDYNRAIHHNSVFDRATLVERWYILARLGRWEEALRVSRKAAIANSQDPLHYFYRGWSFLQLGRLDEAIQVLFVGIGRYPDYPMALYYALGVAYYERQAWSEAIQALEVALVQSGTSSSGSERARSLDFADADILGRMGVAYLELKQCETGGAIVDRAISESTDTDDWTWARGRTEACYISLTPTPTPANTQAP